MEKGDFRRKMKYAIERKWKTRRNRSDFIKIYFICGRRTGSLENSTLKRIAARTINDLNGELYKTDYENRKS